MVKEDRREAWKIECRKLMKSIRGNLCFVSLTFVDESSFSGVPLMFYMLIIKWHSCQLFY